MNDVLKEIQQRVVRIETRLTKFLKAQNEEVPTQPIRFDRTIQRLDVPSRDVSLRDVMAALQVHGTDCAYVYVGDDFIFYVALDDD